MDNSALHLSLELLKGFLTFEVGWIAILLFIRTYREVYLYLAGFTVVGILNVFHGFVSVSDLPVNNDAFTPLTWVVSNTLYPVFVLILFKRPKQFALVLTFSLICSLTIFVVMVSASSAVSPLFFISRPLEILPLLVSVFCLLIIRREHKNKNLHFAGFISLSVLCVQSAVMIWSEGLLDTPFFIAHVLQILNILPFTWFICISIKEEINAKQS